MRSLCLVVVFSCCLALSLAATECQEHRDRELKSNAKVKLVPKCTENGDYEALQCFDGSPFCMCWRPDGSHITDPSNKIKTCQCHAHRDQSIARSKDKRIYGNFVPQCEEDGTYQAKQCNPSTGGCWCVDEKNNQIGEFSRQLKTCACHVHRHKEIQNSDNGMVGNLIPNCKTDGTYAAKQCSGSSGYCWCTDENNNKIGEAVREWETKKPLEC